jgi:hypothetical protein
MQLPAGGRCRKMNGVDRLPDYCLETMLRARRRSGGPKLTGNGDVAEVNNLGADSSRVVGHPSLIAGNHRSQRDFAAECDSEPAVRD